MNKTYLEVSQESGAAFFSKNIEGEIVMLNLIRFKEIADYKTAPEIAPEKSISGKEAFQKYIEGTLPFLKKSGGELLFLGESDQFLIGPQDQKWDFVMLVRQKSMKDFIAFSQNPDYLKVLAHRTAAVEDSRLLPIIETKV